MCGVVEKSEQHDFRLQGRVLSFSWACTSRRQSCRLHLLMLWMCVCCDDVKYCCERRKWPLCSPLVPRGKAQILNDGGMNSFQFFTHLHQPIVSAIRVKTNKITALYFSIFLQCVLFSLKPVHGKWWQERVSLSLTYLPFQSHVCVCVQVEGWWFVARSCQVLLGAPFTFTFVPLLQRLPSETSIAAPDACGPSSASQVRQREARCDGRWCVSPQHDTLGWWISVKLGWLQITPVNHWQCSAPLLITFFHF